MKLPRPKRDELSHPYSASEGPLCSDLALRGVEEERARSCSTVENNGNNNNKTTTSEPCSTKPVATSTWSRTRFLQLSFLHARSQYAFQARMTKARETLEKLSLTEGYLRHRLTTLQVTEIEQGAGLPWVINALHTQATLLAQLNETLSRADIPYTQMMGSVERISSLLPLHSSMNAQEISGEEMTLHIKKVTALMESSVNGGKEVQLIRKTTGWLQEIHATIKELQTMSQEMVRLTDTLTSLSKAHFARNLMTLENKD